MLPHTAKCFLLIHWRRRHGGALHQSTHWHFCHINSIYLHCNEKLLAERVHAVINIPQNKLQFSLINDRSVPWQNKTINNAQKKLGISRFKRVQILKEVEITVYESHAVVRYILWICNLMCTASTLYQFLNTSMICFTSTDVGDYFAEAMLPS